MPTLALACLALPSLIAAQTPSSRFQLISPTPALVSIDKAGNGSVSLLLKNTSNAVVKFNPALVAVTDFVHTPPDGAAYPLGAQTTLSGLPAADVPAGGLFTVKIVVAQAWETGDSTAQLRNGESIICDIVARKEPAPFGVQIDASNPEAVFDRDRAPSVVLVNADRATYRFKWSLIAPGHAPSSPVGPVTIQPNGKLVLNLSAANLNPTWFSDGTLRDEILDGTLELQPLVEPGMAPQPGKLLPLKLRLVFWPKYLEQAFSIFFTAALVLLGMLASLWFRCFIPNATGSIKVRRQLREMDLRLEGVGGDLPSQPRTVLESTIASCYHRLREIPKFLPGFSTALTEVQANVNMCSVWVDCAYSVAGILGESRRMLQSDMPPTLMHLIEDACDHALCPFLSGFTKPEELEAMKNAVKKAQNYLDAAVAGSPIPDLEDIVKTRESRIGDPVLGQLRTDYPAHNGLFNQVDAVMKLPLSPSIYRERDTFSLKADLLKRYRDLALREGATQFPPQAVAAAAASGSSVVRKTMLDRLAERYPDFLSFVDTESYQSLNMARIYLVEMQQDFYPAALIAELAKDPPAIEIHMAPSPVEPGVPVHYSLRFIRDALNHVAAVQEWTLRWKFEDASGGTAEATVAPSQSANSRASETNTGLTEAETGWDIYHRFTAAGTHKVSVTLVAFNGDKIPTSKPIETSVAMRDWSRRANRGRWWWPLSLVLSSQPAEPPVVMRDWSGRANRGQWWWPLSWSPEAKIEGLRVAFVLVIALAAVFVSARQKVEESGLFEGAAALVGIGFAADIAKNALTDNPGDKG